MKNANIRGLYFPSGRKSSPSIAATILRVNSSGTLSIELSEKFGAYSAGDKLCVAQYDFVATSVPGTGGVRTCPFCSAALPDGALTTIQCGVCRRPVYLQLD